MARTKRFSLALTVFLALLLLVLGCGVGFVLGAGYTARHFHSDEAPKMLVNGEMQIHFLELGNKYTGDCTYIKAGETDILIDAGSKKSSAPVIAEYVNQYVTDGKLEYVVVTHAHEDHYAGFSVEDGSIFDRFECGTIIDFALTNNEDSKMYGDYVSERDAEVAKGAKHYTAAEVVADPDMRDGIDLGNNITMKILDSKFYHETTSDENDYSVCTLFSYGDYNYLFTGDLEADGEEELVARNELPEVDLYKAGHHGSKTSSSEELLAVIRPDIVCVCCCAGSAEYTDKNENQFPTQAFVDRIAPYTDRVYVTTQCVDYEAGTFAPMNGTIAVLTDREGVRVECSADPRPLKEWDWFKQNRECPAAWKPAA